MLKFQLTAPYFYNSISSWLIKPTVAAVLSFVGFLLYKIGIFADFIFGIPYSLVKYIFLLCNILIRILSFVFILFFCVLNLFFCKIYINFCKLYTKHSKACHIFSNLVGRKIFFTIVNFPFVLVPNFNSSSYSCYNCIFF